MKEDLSILFAYQEVGWELTNGPLKGHYRDTFESILNEFL